MFKKTIEKTFVEVNGKPLPTKIYREYRKSVRFSIGKTGAILRMPTQLSKEQQGEQIKNFTNWIKKQFSKREALNDRFFGKGYKTGDKLVVGNRTYLLNIEFTDLKSHHASIEGKVINLRLSKNDTESNLQKSIKHLLSRIVAKEFLPEIERRVIELNHLYFQKPIKNVRLKYNQTNWGSCSTRGNINLSTRLLFAPDDVIDYVIIHELAHLLEMNHSNRFWNIVKKAMPEYREKEVWLKKNGHLCDF
jgi:predicted metal-dependent hydrolase